MGTDGKSGKIVHTGNDGKVETITPNGDGTANVQIGDQPPFKAKLDFDLVNGTYSYNDDVSHIAVHNADGSHIEMSKQGENMVVGVSRPDGTRYATTYGADGKIAGVQLHINAKPDQATGETTPERNDTWVPTGNPGELRRNDGVVATDLKWNENGDFSFTYITEKGETLRHTDLADGTQKNVLIPSSAKPA
ncbi:MAG: hypothetical protein HYX67_09245 [Candidatus Melainabacteria bacterium]|nr:hypothetical protein [Candidatus Melainabacteria bacterium]